MASRPSRQEELWWKIGHVTRDGVLLLGIDPLMASWVGPFLAMQAAQVRHPGDMGLGATQGVWECVSPRRYGPGRHPGGMGAWGLPRGYGPGRLWRQLADFVAIGRCLLSRFIVSGLLSGLG